MPSDLRGVSGGSEALALLASAYRSRLRRSGRTAEHPIAVAQLLHDDAQSDDVVVAGLLHDLLEDTDVTIDELADVCGPHVAELVRALSQDTSIAGYRDRKAALRRQILAAGPEAGTVSLADKLAKVRGADERPRKRKLAHYRATLTEVERIHGRSPLSVALRRELARWR